MRLMDEARISRRGFLKGGGALVVTAMAVPASLQASLAKSVASGGPFPIPELNQLSTWLAVKADGTVIARSGHVDLGQGNRTALAQIVAEELDVAFDRVSMVLGNSNQTPDQGVTAGSTTIRLAGAQLREIAAEGRATLLNLAAQHLGVPVSELTVQDGVVRAGSRQVTYGELVRGRALTAVTPIVVQGAGGFGMTISVAAKPKSPSEYTVVGQSIPRVDIPDKVTTRATYVQDVRVPGMLHARVVHPKAVGSTVTSVGTLPANLHARVVRIGNLVAVLAEREWDAIQGAAALQVGWSAWNHLPPSTDLGSALRAMAGPVSVVTQRGDVASALASAPQTLAATYQTPFENHGMLGPSCAVADVRSDGTVTIWSATQYPQGLQREIAEILGVQPTQVEVLWAEGPGCYGRLSANYDDAAAEAALLSQAVGRPVRVQWMRADEHIWEPHGPGTLHDMRAALDASGHVVAWQHEAWMPPNNDSTSLGAALAGRSLPGGRPALGSWTGPDLYTFPNSYELVHQLSELGASASPYPFGLRTTFLRSPGQYQITYAQEAFVDEIAAKAGQDPLQFRLAHLTDQRAIAVLQAVAKAVGWQTRPSPKPGAGTGSGPVTGRGIALVLRDGTYGAGVAEVTVDPSSGQVRVMTFTVAQDSGLIINPKAIEHQIESAVIQTTSRAMLEEVTFDTSNVTSTNWSTYPILPMADAPKVVSVLINRPDIPSTGVGEPAVNLVAPAVSNAIFDATGIRIRQLPMRADRVKAAM
jgi:nicotinate dehydrogenase subunit B